MHAYQAFLFFCFGNNLHDVKTHCRNKRILRLSKAIIRIHEKKGKRKIRLNHLKRKSIMRFYKLTPDESIKFVQLLTKLGFCVRFRPYCADFGYHFWENMNLWNQASMTPCCPSRLLGFVDEFTIYKERPPPKPLNSDWKRENIRKTNACKGPVLLFPRHDLWSKVRTFVKTRGIFWFWYGLYMSHQCAEGQILREQDRIAFMATEQI